VNLTGVANAQTITVTLSGVTDTNAQVLPDAAVSLGILVGDTNGNGAVSSSDISQTKAQSGAPVTAANFREDVGVNGSISSSDISLVKAQSGTSIP
jgi:Dockerin type I domain